MICIVGTCYTDNGGILSLCSFQYSIHYFPIGSKPTLVRDKLLHCTQCWHCTAASRGGGIPTGECHQGPQGPGVQRWRVAPGPGSSHGEPWLSYRQAKRPRVQAPNSIPCPPSLFVILSHPPFWGLNASNLVQFSLKHMNFRIFHRNNAGEKFNYSLISSSA